MANRKNRLITNLLKHCRENPDKIVFKYLVDGESEEFNITYHTLFARVERLSQLLSKHSELNECVILVYQDVIEFIISFLTCQYLGLIAIPAYWSKGSRYTSKLSGIIDNAKSNLIFTESKIAETLKIAINRNNIEFVQTDSLVKTSQSESSCKSKQNFCEISFIQYTSGSTGNSKGVVITENNLISNIEMIQSAFKCTENSIVFSWLPFHHDMGLIGSILQTIYTGCSCILMNPYHFVQKPFRWLSAISRFRVTHSGGPNFAYDLCNDKIHRDDILSLDLSSWQVAYNGAEPLRLETLEQFFDLTKEVGFRSDMFFPCYGLAEGTLLISGRKNSNSRYNTINTSLYDKKAFGNHEKKMQNFVSLGKVAKGIDLIIDGPSKEKCGLFEVGEICISGKNVTSGYFNEDNIDLFMQTTGGKYLRTGDLGFIFNDELYVIGRIKEIIVVKGVNFYPYEIEREIAAISNHINKNGVVVFTKNNEVLIVAELERGNIRGAAIGQIISEINNKVIGLTGSEPLDIVLTSSLAIPRTTSGKLQRLKCLEIYDNNLFKIVGSKKMNPNEKNNFSKDEAIKDVVEGKNGSVEKYLMLVIRSKIPSVQLDAIMYNIELSHLGLDSIKAMELVNIINKDLNIIINLTDVFKTNNINGILTAVQNQLWLKNKSLSGKSIII